MIETTIPTLHPFESAGLGMSPFRLVGFSEKVYSAMPGHIQAAGTCDYCGTGIRYCCHIRSHDNKEFIVGCDCVRKLGNADNKLIGEVDREVAKLAKKKRDEERERIWKEKCERIDRELQSQRERNGGLTDQEVAQARLKKEQEEASKRHTENNRWLLNVLNAAPSYSDFVMAMVEKLENNSIKDLSDRCLDILREIYGKQIGGRKNSKKYNEAVAKFDEMIA